MEELYAIIGLFIVTVLYVNVRVSNAIAKASVAPSKRIYSYALVWLIPILGVLLGPKTVLPKLHTGIKGTGSFTGGDSDGGGCSGGDCG